MNIGSISGNQWLMQNSAYNRQATPAVSTTTGASGYSPNNATANTANLIDSMGTVSSSTMNSLLLNANINQANLNSSFSQLA